MFKRKRKAVYLCKHCGKKWNEHYLSELCFKVDMNNLEKIKNGSSKKSLSGQK
jgi:hypothetical protein